MGKVVVDNYNRQISIRIKEQVNELNDGKVSADKLMYELLKTSRNISEIFCDVFTSEDVDAESESTGQSECCFVFCLFY